jgi:hypothetical protein
MITEGSLEERYIGTTLEEIGTQHAGNGIVMGGSHDNRKGSENGAQVGDMLVLHGEVVVSLRLPASVFISLFFALLVCFYRSVLVVDPTKVSVFFVHLSPCVIHMTLISTADSMSRSVTSHGTCDNHV